MAFTLGMPCLIELDDLRANLDRCVALGLGLLEVNMNLPYCRAAETDPEMLGAMARRRGVKLSVHLPETLDLADIHDAVRAGNIACACEALAWAGRAGATVAVMHLSAGVYFSLPAGRRYIYQRPDADFAGRLGDGLDCVLQAARAAGVTLCIENCGNWNVPFLAETLGGMLERFPDLMLCRDVGHDAESGFADAPLIEAHRDRVAHMHLHDVADGRAHRRLLSGIVDVRGTLAFARDRDIMTVIEVKTSQALADSVAALASLS